MKQFQIFVEAHDFAKTQDLVNQMRRRLESINGVQSVSIQASGITQEIRDYCTKCEAGLTEIDYECNCCTQCGENFP